MKDVGSTSKAISQALVATNVDHLQLVLQRAGLGTFQHDLGSATVRVSPLTCALYGVTPRPEMPLSELLAQVDPSALSDRERTFAQVLAGQKEFYELQYRVGRPLFSRWLSVQGRVVFENDGAHGRRPVRVVGVVSDITAQMERQQSMEQAHAMLDAIGASTDAFMYVKDPDGRMLYCNAAVLRALGKPREEVIGHTDREFLGDQPETRAIAAHDAEVMRTGQAQVYREVLVGQKRTYISTKTPYRNVAGAIVGIAGVSMDITELQQVREALRNMEELASLATEAARIGVYEWDPQVDSLSWSKTMREQFGVEEAGPCSISVALERIHPEDRAAVEAAIAQAMAPEADRDYEIVYRTAPRPEVPSRCLHVFGRVRFEERDGNRVPARFAGVSIDVTHQTGGPVDHR